MAEITDTCEVEEDGRSDVGNCSQHIAAPIRQNNDIVNECNNHQRDDAESQQCTQPAQQNQPATTLSKLPDLFRDPWIKLYGHSIPPFLRQIQSVVSSMMTIAKYQ